MNFSHLQFISYAYPDEWKALAPTAMKPPFFEEYSTAFDPNGQHTGSPYGYTRADSNAILSYDATLALLTGCNNALSGGKTSLTPNDLRQGLTQITEAQAIQGVSGQISFGSDGNPIDKALIILNVHLNNTIGMDYPHLASGTFLKK